MSTLIGGDCAAESFQVLEGDVLDELRKMPSNSFDGCLTDPPYGLEFMGRAWDRGVPGAIVWAELRRSFDGLDYRFLAPIKREFPRDYQRILEYFPLADLEIYRHEHTGL